MGELNELNKRYINRALEWVMRYSDHIKNKDTKRMEAIKAKDFSDYTVDDINIIASSIDQYVAFLKEENKKLSAEDDIFIHNSDDIDRYGITKSKLSILLDRKK